MEKKKQEDSVFNLNKMFKDFLKNSKLINESPIPIPEKEVKLMALEELNFLMININLRSEIAIDFLIDIAKKYAKKE